MASDGRRKWRPWFKCSLINAHPLFFRMFYLLFLSLLGLILLRALPWRTMSNVAPPRPRVLDMFFMAVSAATASSMSTVEMEIFSDTQLAVVTLLMLVGGEIFISMLGLFSRKMELLDHIRKAGNLATNRSSGSVMDDVVVDVEFLPPQKQEQQLAVLSEGGKDEEEARECVESLRNLGRTVMGYMMACNVIGSCSILVYVSVVKSARDVLKNKGIRPRTFAVFTTVSSFSNCGFIPTNENMMAFKNDAGLLLFLATLVLAGNVLYPVCLRLILWVLRKMIGGRWEEKIEYEHLISSTHCAWLAATAAGLVTVQVVLFCMMEWDSKGLEGMSSHQKLIGAVFLSVNSRHAGESIVDLSAISPAVLVLYVFMMYLPPYASFRPIEGSWNANPRKGQDQSKRRGIWKRILVTSPLSYLCVSVILVCITEKDKLSSDPINFSVLNIVIEVVSAYGNVGFSAGYSCERRLKPEVGECRDRWYGFVGSWSSEGKLVLILLMFFGRLKKLLDVSSIDWKIH